MELNTLTVTQLEQKTGWKPKTQANMRSKGELPYSKLGRKVVYFVEDIDKILRTHYIPARTEA